MNEVFSNILAHFGKNRTVWIAPGMEMDREEVDYATWVAWKSFYRRFYTYFHHETGSLLESIKCSESDSPPTEETANFPEPPVNVQGTEILSLKWRIFGGVFLRVITTVTAWAGGQNSHLMGFRNKQMCAACCSQIMADQEKNASLSLLHYNFTLV